MGDESYTQIALTQSIDILAERIHDLTTKTGQPRANEALKLMNPLVGKLHSVGIIASTIAPTSPEVGAMIWGSIAMIATVRPPLIPAVISKILICS